jgi:hypothetical protein
MKTRIMTSRVDQINTTLLCGRLSFAFLIAYTSEAEFELIPNEKVCVSNERVIAVDILNYSISKEIIIIQDLNDWSSNVYGDAYVHMVSVDKVATSQFYNELESHVTLLD